VSASSTRRPAAHKLNDRPAEGLFQTWSRFWFTPTAPTSLHVIRVLAGILFIAWLLPFAGHIDSLFSLEGWFDQLAYTQGLEKPRLSPEQEALIPPEERVGPLEPVIGWSLLFVKAVGGNPAVLTAVYWSALAVFALFALGVATRLTAVLTWVAVVSFTANPAILYDGDSYLLVLAFYLMVGYVLLGQRTPGLSWVGRLVGTGDTLPFLRRGEGVRPSLAANLALRLLQVHLAIIMVTSGLHKLQFGDWWGGLALWYPLYPAGQATLDQAREYAGQSTSYLFFLSIGAYAVLFWQIGFPLFAWRPAWRPVLLLGALIGWLADSFLFRLPLMGPALFILSLSFVTAEEWQRLFARLARLPGLRRLAPPAEEPEEITPAGVRDAEPSTFVTVGHR